MKAKLGGMKAEFMSARKDNQASKTTFKNGPHARNSANAGSSQRKDKASAEEVQ